MMVFTVGAGTLSAEPSADEPREKAIKSSINDLTQERKEIFLQNLNKTLANINEIKLNRGNKMKKTGLIKKLSEPESGKSFTSHQSSSTSNNTLSKKYSTRCLIVFSLISALVVVICSILTVILTTNLLIKASQNSQLNQDLVSKFVFKIADKYRPTRNASLISNGSMQLERNAFNWIRDQLYNVYGHVVDRDQYISNTERPIYVGANFNQDCGVPRVNYKNMKTRIMNGKEAAPHSWPFVVSIALDGPRDFVPHACGAALLNSRYVITAAHCVLTNSVFSLVGTPDRNVFKHSTIERMIRVNIGIHDRFHDVTEENVYGVERIITHYDFDLSTFKNDIAIIKLDRDVVKSENNGFVCITKSSQVAPGEAVTAVGWGYTEFSRNQASRFLMQVDLIVQRKDNCLIQYVDHDQFCAGNVYKKKDTCNGDSGGPLLKLINNRWTLVGIVSNGDISCSGTGIYINVPFYFDWIIKNIS